MPASADLASALVSLGFSQYEARTYVGLLSGYGQTAYAVAKLTGVPQPKIYEAVRRLVDRGAAVQLSTDPQRFAATPVDELLEALRHDFSSRMDDAERTAAEALRAQEIPAAQAQVIRSIPGRDAALALAGSLVARATTKLYVSAWGPELGTLEDAIRDAEDRGVEVVALAFGRSGFRLRRGALYHHGSTADVLYRSHRNRHLGVIADGRLALWSVSFGGDEWSSLEFDDRRLVGLLRNFIRHDVYVQRIYSELRPEMHAAFGPSLERLTDIQAHPESEESTQGQVS